MNKFSKLVFWALLGFHPLGYAAPSIIDTLRPGQWLELPNTKMQDVFPKEAGHPAWGVLGPKAVTLAWGGAAFDTKRNVLVVTGGGHTDYGGNEVYEFDLKKLKWTRATEPSAMTDLGNGKVAVIGSEAPPSSHTYDGLVYLPNVGQVFKFGGSYYRNGWSNDRHAYLYSVETKKWQRRAEAPREVLQVSASYDPKTGVAIVGTGNGLMRYDPIADKWATPPQRDGSISGSVAAFDPDNRLFVQVAAATGNIEYYAVDKADVRITARLTGDVDWGRGPGMAYHSPSKRMYVWAGGGDVWTFSTDNWVAHKLVGHRGPAPTFFDAGNQPKARGIYGRWQYVPDYDVFIAYVHSTDNVWLYKPSLALPDEITQPSKAVACEADLCVGPGFRYSRPSEAAQVAKDGQTLFIAAGNYDRDATVWKQNNLTIRGIGGRAHVRAKGAQVEGKGTWVIKGDNATVENIEFSGAVVSDENGAGIRLEGTSLTIRNCYFHDNQTGILTGANRLSDVIVENSEFTRAGANQAHNIYIGSVRKFVLKYSYVHHARIGHNVKSRAAANYILYNRIMDEADGNSSYALNLPNGGLTYVIGNLIQQGPHTENNKVVSYGEEGLKNALNELYFVNNTVVNDAAKGQFLFVKQGTGLVKTVNNIFAGPGKVLDGPGTQDANLSVDKADLMDAAHYDYHLKSGSRAINAGVDPGEAHGFSLTPEAQYTHPLRGERRNRVGAIDVGAYEYQGKS